MAKSRTIVEDSGFDCDHCGGVIYRHTKPMKKEPARVFYQCRTCGCQWTPEGEALRVGGGEYCEAAMRERMPHRKTLVSVLNRFSRGAWIAIAVGLGLVFFRFGSLITVVRVILPVLVLVVILYFLVRYGRSHQWW